MTHTTNDAPVTVEQCDRDEAKEIVRDLIGSRAASFACNIEPTALRLARHRLAALASAPAGDGVEQADRDAALLTVPNDGSHSSHMMAEAIEEGRADEWPFVQAFARRRLATTALVTEFRAFARYLTEPPANTLDEKREVSVRMILAVAQALDRPRAAVGEREDDIGLAEAAQDLLDAQKRLGPAVAFRLDLWACLEANLESVS